MRAEPVKPVGEPPILIMWPDREDASVGKITEYLSILKEFYGVEYACHTEPGWYVCKRLDSDTRDMGVTHVTHKSRPPSIYDMIG